MSDLPQSLWQPSPKDVASRLAARTFYRHLADTGAAAAARVRNTGPLCAQDEIAIVRHVGLLASATGGQLVTAAFLDISDQTAIPILARLIHYAPEPPATNPPTLWRSIQVEFEVSATEQLVASAFYSAGVAANFLSIHVAGIIIPRGNWQRQ